MSTFQVLNPTLTFDEDAGQVYVQLQRDTADGYASVNLQLTNLSAGGDDYSFNASQLPVQFTDGQLTAAVALWINDDFLVESSEDLRLTLIDPSPGHAIDPNQATTTITIQGNDVNPPGPATIPTASSTIAPSLSRPRTPTVRIRSSTTTTT